MESMEPALISHGTDQQRKKACNAQGEGDKGGERMSALARRGTGGVSCGLRGIVAAGVVGIYCLPWLQSFRLVTSRNSHFKI